MIRPMPPPPLSSPLAAAVAGAGLAFALQVAVPRAEGVPVPHVVLPALGLVLLSLHVSAALILGRRPRLHAFALLLGPATLAILPLVDRKLGAAGVLAALALWPVIVGLLAYKGPAPGSPVVAAALGAALAATLGVALIREANAAEAALQAPPGAWAVVAVAVLAALLAVARPIHASPRAASCLALAGLSGVGGILLASRPVRPRPGPPESRARTAAPVPPPAVLIVVDTVRADHLKSYGYSRDTMPELERFARTEMVQVDRAIASGGSSLPSHGSMFTGLLPSFHGGHGATKDESRPALHPMRSDVPTLAQLLRRAGYWTVGLSANCGQLAPAMGTGRGFSFYQAVRSPLSWFAASNPYRGALRHRFPLAALDRFPPFDRAEFFEAGSGASRADVIVDQALTTIHEAGDTPFFLFVNLFDPHVPYRPPIRAGQAFPARRPGPFVRVESQLTPELLQGRAEEARADLVALYDAEIRFADAELGRLLEALRAHPRYREMLIVVTSDHGEGFGEHGHFSHGTTLHDEIARVPLFVKPGLVRPERFRPPGRLPGPFQSVDLFPTFLAHAGLPAPAAIDGAAWAEGRDRSFAEEYLSRWSEGRSAPEPRLEIRLSEAGGLKALVSARGEPLLYDVARDPLEREDLARARPEALRSLEDALTATLTRKDRTRPPTQSERLPAEVTRSLRALGYLN